MSNGSASPNFQRPELLPREEYVEQAFLFQSMSRRITDQISAQDLLEALQDEVLATTKLPMAIGFMASELRLTGGFASAMSRLPHYFTAFQTFLAAEAENERSRFDFIVACEVLRREALYRAEGMTPQGGFVFQFEVLSRNRLGYDKGLIAMAKDPIFDDDWSTWILSLRSRLGLIGLGELMYVRSQQYVIDQQRRKPHFEPSEPILFGEKEGKIALANRRKDPLLLFSALQRHLQYPEVPRPQKPDQTRDLTMQLMRRVERIEARLKLMEEENREGAVDLDRLMRDLPPMDDGFDEDER